MRHRWGKDAALLHHSRRKNSLRVIVSITPRSQNSTVIRLGSDDGCRCDRPGWVLASTAASLQRGGLGGGQRVPKRIPAAHRSRPGLRLCPPPDPPQICHRPCPQKQPPSVVRVPVSAASLSTCPSSRPHRMPSGAPPPTSTALDSYLTTDPALLRILECSL